MVYYYHKIFFHSVSNLSWHFDVKGFFYDFQSGNNNVPRLKYINFFGEFVLFGNTGHSTAHKEAQKNEHYNFNG